MLNRNSAPVLVHDTLLLFGATGDLSQRYLFPSLVHLLRDRLLPADFRLIAIGRQDYDQEGFKSWLREQLPDEATRNREAFNDLLARTRYVAVDLSDSEQMSKLLAEFSDRPCVSYLAIPELKKTIRTLRDRFVFEANRPFAG